jgi:hypothetical protein
MAHAESMPVRHENPNALRFKTVGFRRNAGKVAVSADKPHRKIRHNGCKVVKIPLAVSKVKQKVRVALLQTRKLIQGMKVAVRVRDHNDAQGHILLFACRGKAGRSPGNAKLA